MAKVLVEKPRPGSRHGLRPVKGYRKRVRKGLAAEDGPPQRESMLARHRGHERFFNENLSPLRRFVLSRVGRPWDKVYAEICERIDRGNVVQKHILTHLYDYVLTRVILIDGEPCWGVTEYSWSNWYGRPLREMGLRHMAYVCPRTGLLKRIPQRRNHEPSGRPKPPDCVRVNDRLQCRFIWGQWELVTLAPLPDAWHRAKATETDAVLGKPVANLTPSEAQSTYGAAVYAVARRILGKREQMQYPIPIEFIR